MEQPLSYALLSYQSQDGPRAGVAVGETVHAVDALTGKSGYATMLGVLEDWDASQPAIEASIRIVQGKSGVALSKVRLLPPVLYPSCIFCAGANYSDHVLEMAKAHGIDPEPDPRTLGLKPWHFIKAPRATVAANSVVPLPAYSQMVDWEAELAAVIGKPARNVSVADALNHVAGYTIANDLSARDFTRRPHVAPDSPFKYDWMSQKCFEGSCPIGPWIVPAKQIADPQNLKIELTVNGVLKQDSHTSRMIFTLADQIAHLSTRLTLHPGDVILTGTPAGVGMARKEFLKPGDVVSVTIENIGTLTNTIA